MKYQYILKATTLHTILSCRVYSDAALTCYNNEYLSYYRYNGIGEEEDSR